MARWLVLTVLALVVGCTGGSNYLLDLRDRGVPLVATYFPRPALTDAEDEFVAPISALHLSQMGEKPLVTSGVTSAVRVLWMTQGFAGDALIRIEQQQDGTIRSVFKRFPGGDVPYSISAHSDVLREKPIAQAEFLKLMDKIRDTRFFALGNRDQALVSGGYTWLVEVYDHGQYHVAYCNLDSKPEINEIGTMAAQLSTITRKDLPIEPLPGE